jgi:hypothetical protein
MTHLTVYALSLGTVTVRDSDCECDQRYDEILSMNICGNICSNHAIEAQALC